MRSAEGVKGNNVVGQGGCSRPTNPKGGNATWQKKVE
jgi:hypothetical protein